MAKRSESYPGGTTPESIAQTAYERLKAQVTQLELLLVTSSSAVEIADTLHRLIQLADLAASQLGHPYTGHYLEMEAAPQQRNFV